jgi:hypothetical protein
VFSGTKTAQSLLADVWHYGNLKKQLTSSLIRPYCQGKSRWDAQAFSVNRVRFVLHLGLKTKQKKFVESRNSALSPFFIKYTMKRNVYQQSMATFNNE